jgi:hypothetical protein
MILHSQMEAGRVRVEQAEMCLAEGMKRCEAR